MRAPLSLTVAVVTGLMSLAMPARAQSLGDLAKQEAERRKALTEPARVITDKDVPVVAPAQPSPSAKPADTATADAGKTAAEGDKPKDDAKPETETRDQKYWSERYQGLHQ